MSWLAIYLIFGVFSLVIFYFTSRDMVESLAFPYYVAFFALTLFAWPLCWYWFFTSDDEDPPPGGVGCDCDYCSSRGTFS